VSSKVNQWTLLVGTLPIAFAIASGSLHGLPLDSLQREELFLTAGQSLFAVAILANLEMSIGEAWWLLSLFLVQFVAGAVGPESMHDDARVITGIIYVVLGVYLLARKGPALRKLFRDGFRTPYSELVDHT
jgi:cation:H+ antiporter